MRYPVDQRIKVPGIIPFGQPDPNAKHGYHAGDDSANGIGTNVYAPASGTVYSVADSGNQGIAVQIFDGQYYPHVFHLSQRLVSAGQKVSEGQLIGKSGNTGLSTGPHVHFGVGKKPYLTTQSINDYIDPMEYVAGGEDEMTQQEAYAVVAEIFRGVTDVDPVPANADYWAKKIQDNPASAAELAKTLYGEYKGDKDFRYKGRHYDEDMKTKYQQGLADGGAGTPKVTVNGAEYVPKK